MKTYGLVGYPLGHSFSKRYFTEKFEKQGLKAEYLNFEMRNIAGIKDVLAQYPGLMGFNVTIPYKQDIIPLLDQLDWGITGVNAVNTVKVMPDGSWKGFNTDVIGFEKSIREVTDLDRHPGALILGSGGASKAVQLALRKYSVPYTVISRTPDEQLFEVGYDAIPRELIQESTLIINTTPLGMSPDVEGSPDIDYSALTPGHICMDLVYNPSETVFMKRSRAEGAVVLNGYNMLVFQAEAAWNIWNDSL